MTIMKQTAIHQTKRAHHSQWFNKWIQSPKWFVGFGIACLVSVVVYAINAATSELDSGNVWGISYGIAATVVFVGVVLYGVRRRTMNIRQQPRSWHYLQFHVYGGTLFLVFIGMHSHFSIPNGTITWWLWVLSIWIVVSGLIGIVLQKWIPTVLNRGLSVEVHYDRIPALVSASKEKAEALISERGEHLRGFYKKHVADTLLSPQPRLMYFLDASSSIQNRVKAFDHVGPYMPREDKETFEELKLIYKTKLEMDVHYTLQRALRWWIYAHAPLSVLLIILLVTHIFSVVYY